MYRGAWFVLGNHNVILRVGQGMVRFVLAKKNPVCKYCIGGLPRNCWVSRLPAALAYGLIRFTSGGYVRLALAYGLIRFTSGGYVRLDPRDAG